MNAEEGLFEKRKEADRIRMRKTEKTREVNMIKLCYVHARKCHNETYYFV
jgi:hypothetical protein